VRFLRLSSKVSRSLFLCVGQDWVHLVRRPLFGLLHQPRMMDNDERGAISVMLGKRNRSALRKPGPVPLCPPQIPDKLIWATTRAAVAIYCIATILPSPPHFSFRPRIQIYGVRCDQNGHLFLWDQNKESIVVTTHRRLVPKAYIFTLPYVYMERCLIKHKDSS
jgi:hypothetical protein